MWWAPGAWMFIAPLLFVLCLGMMFFMMRSCMPHWMMRDGMPRADRNPKRALDILEERFAKGEIDQAEFEERRRSLNG